jgi:hypothetical protein
MLITLTPRSGACRPWTVAVVSATGTALLAGVAAHGYSLKAYKWNKSQASYFVNPANHDVAESAAEAAVRAGADAWSTQSNASFAWVYAGRTTASTVSANGKSEVFFRNESNGSTIATTYWWSDASGHLVEADIKFYDGGYKFFTGTSCSAGQFIEDVATHEFGHGLGLNHSSLSTATMYPTNGACSQNWRTLSADDIAGVEKLYPPSSLLPIPSAPSGLSVTLNLTNPSSSTKLSWSDNSSTEDSFLVERSTDGSIFTQVARLGSNAVNYTDTGLTSGKRYFYRVRASNSSGLSGYTNIASVTTANGTSNTTGTPGTPTNPKPTNGATGLSIDTDLAWTASGATGYDVYFGKQSTPPLLKSSVTSPSMPLSRLSRYQTYYWRIVARNSNGTTSGPIWRFRTRK